MKSRSFKIFLDRKKVLYLFIIFNILFLSSCDSDTENTTLNVSVSEFYSNEPIENFKIDLLKIRNLQLFSPDYSIDTLITNPIGTIDYSFNTESGYYYQLHYISNNLYSSFDKLIIQEGETNQFDIKVKRFICLKLNLINNTNQFESIWITGNSGKDLIYNSAFIDTVLFFNKITPEEYQNLRFRLYTENMFDNYSEIDTSLYVNKIDTLEFVFNN